MLIEHGRHNISTEAKGLKRSGTTNDNNWLEEQYKLFTPYSIEAQKAWYDKKQELYALIAVLIEPLVNHSLGKKAERPPFGLLHPDSKKNKFLKKILI